MMSRLSLSLSSVLITLRYAARLLFVPLEKVRVRVKSSGVIDKEAPRCPSSSNSHAQTSMGSPRSPKSPKTHKARFRLPWDYRKKTGSTRVRFFTGGDFVRLMSSRDKKNARATLEAQQYLDGVYRACAVAPTAAPPAFLADVFAESPRKKRRQA